MEQAYYNDHNKLSHKINKNILVFERSKIMGQKYYGGSLSNYAQMVGTQFIGKGQNFIFKKLQEKFGRPFMIDRENYGESIRQAVINQFIKKYDKHFDDHTQDKNGSIRLNDDSMLLIPLYKDKKGYTGMYVATGVNIGNSEMRFLTNNPVSSEDIFIYIFGKRMQKYAKELENLIEAEFNKNSFGIFTIDKSSGNRESESLDILYMDLEPRSLNTLYFSDREKEDICALIDRFEGNSSFYKDRQLLYKTGILLHGQPGTGKSSLIKALGSTYGRSLVSINVNNIKYINLNSLTQSINVDDVRKYIIMLEDIDTLYLNRDESEEADKMTINKLLQFLDSNTSPNNVIFIATTNHIERLDQALLREGRFDLKVEVNPLLAKDANAFIKSFGLNEKEADEIKEAMVEKNKGISQDANGNMRYNQSTLQAMILSKINKKDLNDIINIYGDMIDTSVIPEPEQKTEEDTDDEW